jgi:hypothetical protein
MSYSYVFRKPEVGYSWIKSLFPSHYIYIQPQTCSQLTLETHKTKFFSYNNVS